MEYVGNNREMEAYSLIQVQRAWRELAQKAIQNDQESVWDVDPSLKGPPAAHGSI